MLICTFFLFSFLVVIISVVVKFKEGQYVSVLSKLEIEHDLRREILDVQIETSKVTIDEVASDIHDHLGQKVSLAKLYISMVSHEKEKEKMKEKHDATIKILSEIMEYVRDIKRYSATDFFNRNGLISASNELMTQVTNSGSINASMIVHGSEIKIDDSIQYVLFRIMQESVNNSIKHSQCKCILVELSVFVDEVVMKVSDDGIGFDLTMVDLEKSSGLRNMRRRASMCGGSIRYDRINDKTVLTVKTINYDQVGNCR
jgi:signal transduction histidine kinase